MDFWSKFSFVLVILSICCPIGMIAQTYDNGEEDELYKLKMVNLSFEIVSPQGRYQDQLGETGWGISYSFLKELTIEKPSYMGIDVFWNRFFSSSDFFTNGVGVPIEDRLSGGSLGLHLVYRYYLPLPVPIFDFYVDGVMGGRFLYSLNRSFIETTGENIDIFISEKDIVASYGLGVGAQIYIKNNYFLDLNATFQNGTSGTYDGRDDSTFSGYGQKNSTTNMIRFKIGVTYLN